MNRAFDWVHLGTPDAALHRIDPDHGDPDPKKSNDRNWMPHSRLFRVRVSPGARVCPHIHGDPQDDEENDDQDLDLRKCGGEYDVHRYRNSVEDAGKISIQARPSVLQVAEDLGRHPKWQDPQVRARWGEPQARTEAPAVTPEPASVGPAAKEKHSIRWGQEPSEAGVMHHLVREHGWKPEDAYGVTRQAHEDLHEGGQRPLGIDGSNKLHNHSFWHEASRHTAKLSDEALVSVAEHTMEQNGHAGRTWHVPKMHADDPQRQEAHQPVHDFVRGVLTQHGYEHARGINVIPSHWDLREPGSGQAMVNGMGTIGLKGEHTNDMTLLHECAHILTRTPEGPGGHGPQFQQAAHRLYHDHISPEAADAFNGIVHALPREGVRHTAADEHPPPYPNPKGGDEWFLGTKRMMTEMSPRSRTDPGEEGRHWNSDLGVHWTSRHQVAKNFSRSRSWDRGIAHAHLHMGNPKVFESEFDLDKDAIDHAVSHGLTRSDDRRNPSPEHPIDRRGWLDDHPHLPEIVSGYRDHLRSQGHDGIIYGNEYESGKRNPRHPCAITFPDTPVSIKHWETPDSRGRYSDHPEYDGHYQVPRADGRYGFDDIPNPHLPYLHQGSRHTAVIDWHHEPDEHFSFEEMGEGA